MFGSIKRIFKDIIKGNEEYNNLINNASIISNLQPLPELQRKNIAPEILTKKNSNITKEKGTIILDLLPINDLYLELLYGIEVKTNKEYYIVPTTNYLWIISKEGYIRYEYNSLKAAIIKSSFITKTINISNFIFEVYSMDEEVNNFISIINNKEYRDNLISDYYNKYGDNEVNRLMNKIGSGISYDSNKNIRFYSLTINRRYNIKDIINYELLVDNGVVQEKKAKNNNRLTTTKNTCYEIKIRVTPNDNNDFEIPILNQDAKSSLFQNTTDTYITNMEFAKSIMDTLDELDKPTY